MALLPNNPYPNAGNQYPARQYTSKEGSGQFRGEFGAGQSMLTEVWDFTDLRNLAAIVESLVGYSAKGGNGNIQRILPAQHQIFKWCWCSKVSVEGMRNTPDQPIVAGGVANWDILRTTITFETPPYNMLKDADIGVGEEWKRFVVWGQDNAVEFFTRRDGVFIFNGFTPTVSGQAIPDSTGSALLITKIRKTALWVQVPDDGLFDSGGFRFSGRARNIEGCVGRVNNDTFMGYERGTLLLESWKPIARVLPVDPITIGLFNQALVPRSWDVELQLLHFDPPYDPADTSVPSPRGHNLVPHPTNGYWYRAYLQFAGATDTSRFWRYQEADFNKIFKMNF